MSQREAELKPKECGHVLGPYRCTLPLNHKGKHGKLVVTEEYKNANN